MGNRSDHGEAHLQGCSTYSISDEERETLQQAVLLDMPDPCGASCNCLPWLAVPDEAFCSLLLAILPQDQAFRVTCAAVNILGLRLGALAVPASQSMATAVGQLGMPWF